MTGRTCHWFRSDLRISDNTALRAAAQGSEALHLVFVFDPSLLHSERQGPRRCRFLAESVRQLGEDLRAEGQVLHTYLGKPEEVLGRLQESHAFERVTWNRDTSPFATARDRAVRAALEGAGAEVQTFKDRVIFESQEILTKRGKPFSVYTPYRKTWELRVEGELEGDPGQPMLPAPVEPDSTPLPTLDDLGLAGTEAVLVAGEVHAQGLLHDFLDSRAAQYASARDALNVDATSRLSPYLRLGVVSPRQCLRAALAREAEGGAGVRTWIHQLIWRDFYAAVLQENPYVIRSCHRREYDHVQWENDPELFEAWCEGRTGFPLVDAGMRQLNETGFMHNRSRMITASFLTKDLHVDWRWGERYFMQQLLDGDPANNNGGWQWAASTGTDAQPYFRIFNPVSQSQKFDPDGDYIRRWVPELRDLRGAAIHEPWERPLEAGGYPARVVDHKQRRLGALDMYKAARAKVGK